MLIFYFNVIYNFSKVLMLYFLYKAIQDPGYIDPQEIKKVKWSEISESRFCSFCMIYQPLRSRHCRRCNRCVARFDHHCVFINNCVGSSNHKYFLLCIVLTLLNHVVWFYLVYIYLFYPRPETPFTGSFLELYFAEKYLISFVFFEFMQFFSEFVLVYVQTKNMINNLTMMESFYSGDHHGHSHGDGKKKPSNKHGHSHNNHNNHGHSHNNNNHGHSHNSTAAKKVKSF